MRKKIETINLLINLIYIIAVKVVHLNVNKIKCNVNNKFCFLKINKLFKINFKVKVTTSECLKVKKK